MKRLFALICGALLAGASVAATTVPVQLLNPAGSSAGQAIVSTGASSAPEWTTVPLLNGANTWSSAQVFNGSVNANAGLSVGSANMIFPTASGLSFGVQNSFIGEADYEASAPTGNRATYRYIDPNGVLHYTFYNDTFTSGVDWLTIQRSGNSASSIVFSGAATFTGLISPSSTIGIKGTATNDDAQAGSIGEFLSNSATGISVTSASFTPVTSIPLTAGDWEVWGNLSFTPTDTMTGIQGAVSDSTTAFDTGNRTVMQLAFAAGRQDIPVQRTRYSIPSGGKTIYLLTYLNFATGTCTANGWIYARRVR